MGVRARESYTVAMSVPAHGGGVRIRSEPMSDDSQCTELGCMTPAQVVQCAEGSNAECWIAATMVGPDGAEVAYECCGGGGKKARFSFLKRGAPPREVSAADVPSSLTWVRRTAI